MIRVFNIPAITWTLTAVLLLSGSYHLLQATKPHQLTDRVNNTLHALMNILMAAMLWNLAPSTMLAQIAVLTGAALWFIIQAVARTEFKILCAGSQGRLKCVYHSLSMAGAALMITMMTSHITTGPAGAPANGASDGTAGGTSMPVPMPATHHATSAAPHTATPDTATTAAGLGDAPAILLTIVFAAAATTFLILLLRRHTASTHHTTTRKRATRTKHGLEALGAATMALMFATMIP